VSDSIDQFFAEWRAQAKSGGFPAVPEDAQYLYRIMRICKALGDRLDATCRRHVLTRSQFEAMAVLRRHHPAPLAAKDLMEAAFLTSGSVTAMLGHLLDKGLVVREVHNSDKRRIKVQLTPAGLEKIESAIKERIEDNVAIAQALPEDSRNEINGLLRQVLTGLESMTVTEK